MSYGFRFYDANGNVTVDSTNKSFRSVYRQQVFPVLGALLICPLVLMQVRGTSSSLLGFN
ncbi:hypothetical protein phiPA13_57 [Pseudomonas phage phiPA1-3]|nr:hypothetical protein phiPA13_57 [Pseudomonas phage phiPA1-3]